MHTPICIDQAVIDGLPIRTARMDAKPATGQPPLLIFNGIGANLEILLPFMAALENVAVLTFDLPGVGGSPCAPLPLRFDELVALGHAWVEHCGFEAVDVLGFSWGGGLAQEFAHRYPHYCRRLVLASTSTGACMIPGDISVLFKLASPRRYLEQDYLRKHAGELYGGRLRSDPQLIEDYLQLLQPLHSPWDYYRQLYAGIGWTSIHWLHELQQPTLILAGREDPITPLENAHWMHRCIPDSTLVELDDGHLLLFASHEESARSIGGFLRAQPVLH